MYRSKTARPRIFSQDFRRALRRFLRWQNLAIMIAILAPLSVAHAITFTHLSPQPTWSDTSISALGGTDYFGTSAVRQDQNVWVIGIRGDGFTPTYVARKRFLNGVAQPIEQLNDATHFTNMAASGQRMALFSYIGASATGDRNTIYAYVGTDNNFHYGQVKTTVPTGAFSQNKFALPTAIPGTFAPGIPPAIAASGSCTLGGKAAGTCVYFFIQDSVGFIYYKWIDCPTNGDCSALSSSTTVQVDGTPVSTSWNRIESGGYIPSIAGPTAAQVTNNTIMVLAGIDFEGFPLSWNLAANTGVLLLSNSWTPPSGTEGGLFSSAFAATTYNRGVYASGTGCAQVIGIGNGPNNHTWSMATCDGTTLQTPWQDITGPGGLGVQSLSETFPGATPKFDITSGSLGGITGSIWKASYVTN